MTDKGQFNSGRELSALSDTALVGLASSLATKAHGGQKRKNGEPYFNHSSRVAAMMPTYLLDACAWLHDTMEKEAAHPLTVDDLRKAGVPERVIEVVTRLTRRDKETYLDYIMRIAAHPLAVEVKLGDLQDNLSDLSAGNLREKYLMAQHILQVSRPNSGKHLRAWVDSNNAEALCMDGHEYDVAIVGMCHQFGRPSVAAYDLDKVLHILMQDGCTYEEAYEYWEYNQVGAWVGETTPVFITLAPVALATGEDEED